MNEEIKTWESTPQEKKKKWKKKIIFIIIFILTVFWAFAWYNYYENITGNTLPKKLWWCNSEWICLKKPIIYLYPEQEQKIKVQLDFKGKLFASYPSFDEKIWWWEVFAKPNWDLVNLKDNKEYSYLFWEWVPEKEFDISKIKKWFVIKWDESKEFLQEILPKMWMFPKEYNEFIVYWFPIMQKNTYNIIYFAGEEYTKQAPLNIYPKPKSELRVFMYFKWTDKKIDLEAQEFSKFERKGFSVVEWWGAEIE